MALLEWPEGTSEPPEGKVWIYALYDPTTGKERYIGKTSRPLEARLSEHINNGRLCYNNHLPVVRWVKKLLNKGQTPGIKPIDAVDNSIWEEKEVEWISNYRRIYDDLLNVGDGGEGNIPPDIYQSEEWREMQRRTTKEWWANMSGLDYEELLWKRSVGRKGITLPPLSDKHKQIISEANKGREFTEEHRKNISEGLKNSKKFKAVKASEAYREKLSKIAKARMAQYRQEHHTQKECGWCGEEMSLPPSRRSRKYCSRSCYKDWREDKSRKNKVRKTCEKCGHMMILYPSESTRMYCSMDCKVEGSCS